MRAFLSGNEAIARGAYECGVTFAAAYPGTPSTEITENFARYEGVYAEWAPNEKVALEVCIGAALAGIRAMAVMKHVGVNVAADPLFTVSYTGIEGGLVIVTADDPSMHSSQNEQDNRNYARFAKVPMLEPGDSQEAKEFVKHAFEISERFDTPVFLRSVTRLSHSKSIVSLDDPVGGSDGPRIRHDREKYVMVPAMARLRRGEVETRMTALREYAEGFSENRIEMNNPSVGIIAAGVAYNYAKDVYPHYSFLKLGMVNPLPEELIRRFAADVETLYIVEELDPFIEDQVRAMGITVTGKERLPAMNEFNPGIVEKAFTENREPSESAVAESGIPARPPNLCPGCPHRGLFYAAGRLGCFVTGDIGCYTLSFMKPLEGIDSCICMGASVGMAHGMSKALGDDGKGKVIGVIGDSTFIHSGITPLLNAAYNRSNAVTVICDNRTTAMTGMQEHPGTGRTLQGEETVRLDFARLAGALGVENVRIVDPLNIQETKTVLKEELAKDGPSLVVASSPCALLKMKKSEMESCYTIDTTACTGCKVCIGLGCPAISWRSFETYGIPVGGKKENKKQKGVAVIDALLCTGCSLCQQVCTFDAITEVRKNDA